MRSAAPKCQSKLPVKMICSQPSGEVNGNRPGSVILAGLSEIVCRLVHVERVPEYDGSDDEVESHGVFLVRGIRSIIDAALRMGEYGTSERVTGCILVEAGLTFHAAVTVFDPVEHEQRPLILPISLSARYSRFCCRCVSRCAFIEPGAGAPGSVPNGDAGFQVRPPRCSFRA